MKTYEATPNKLKIPASSIKEEDADDKTTLPAVAAKNTQEQQELHEKKNIAKPSASEQTTSVSSPPDQTSPATASASQIIIERHDVLNKGVAFVLKNFLTPDECRDFIQQAEAIGLSDCGYSKRIRKTDRVAAESGEVAQLLFDRLKPFLEPSVDLSRKFNTARYPEGVSKSIRPYDWRPVGLNPTFRICRYKKKGFFLPHHDGGFFVNEYYQSVKTFMVYLNDDFEGGETCFYNEVQRHYQKPDPDNVVCTYRPQAGDALIFNSHITHDGGKLLTGQKYIMRSEIMYHAPVEEEEHALKSRASHEPDHDLDVEFTWP